MITTLTLCDRPFASYSHEDKKHLWLSSTAPCTLIRLGEVESRFTLCPPRAGLRPSALLPEGLYYLEQGVQGCFFEVYAGKVLL